MSAIIAATRRRSWVSPEPDEPQPIPYDMPTAAPYNTPVPAITPTYDGSGESVHPDVIDFHHITGEDWRGWRYWMVMTPYPGSNALLENPSILVSADGFNWQPPPGVSNPVYPSTGYGWQSDPDMIWHPVEDRLVMVWRPHRLTQAIGRSYDGITWTSARSASKQNPSGLSGDGEMVSPAMVLEGNLWRIWGLFIEGARMVRYDTTDVYDWGAPIPCDVGFSAPGESPWHMDVIKHDGRYLMLFSTSQGIYASSSADGTTWTTSPTRLINSGNGSPYRPTFQPHEDGVTMRVWYSRNQNNVWGTHYTHIPITEWPT